MTSAISFFPQVHLGGLHPQSPNLAPETNKGQPKRQDAFSFTIADFFVAICAFSRPSWRTIYTWRGKPPHHFRRTPRSSLNNPRFSMPDM